MRKMGAEQSSAQAGPQVAGTDPDDQDAHHTADQDVRQPALDAGPV